MAHFGASCQRPLDAIAAQATLPVNIGGLCSADAVCAILNALTMLYVREKLPLKPSAIGSEGVGDLQTALQRMSRFDVQQKLPKRCHYFSVASAKFLTWVLSRVNHRTIRRWKSDPSIWIRES